MIKTPLFLLAFAMASSGQAPAAAPPALGVATMQANVQILSAATVRAKYGMALPKGMSAASVVAENDTASMIVLGQGSIVKALRDRNYPALSRADAAAAIIHAQRSGPMGFLLENVPFGSKLLGDIEDLAVSGAIKVAPGIGVGIAIGSAVLQKLAPDIVARITQFQASYDADGIQNLVQLSPGQSAVGTVILDTPGKGVAAPTGTFTVSVPVVAQ